MQSYPARTGNPARPLTVLVIVLLALFSFVPLTRAQSSAEKNDYSKPDNWLCRPGRTDACSVDLTTTVVEASGKMTRETFTADAKAPIDCFYVYPTVSLDKTANSDMIAGPEENNVVRSQLARFGSACRIYAPLYRQITLTALRSAIAGTAMQGIDRMLAYNDVKDAWNYYLEHENQGRGVVLIGHSQGSGVLTQLIRNEIDGKPVQERLISALLLGTSLAVPRGKDVGGAFQHIPLCKTATQVGCAIAYASFRANVPPPANSRFGRVTGENMVAACVNPADLSGDKGALHAYLSGRQITSSSAEPKPWVNPPKPVDTPFVSVPGLLTAKCVSDDKFSYLAVTVHGNAEDPRVDDIAGDVVRDGQVQQDWGLHLIDVNLAIGNLVDIVKSESKAYLAGRKK